MIPNPLKGTVPNSAVGRCISAPGGVIIAYTSCRGCIQYAVRLGTSTVLLLGAPTCALGHRRKDTCTAQTQLPLPCWTVCADQQIKVLLLRACLHQCAYTTGSAPAMLKCFSSTAAACPGEELEPSTICSAAGVCDQSCVPVTAAALNKSSLIGTVVGRQATRCSKETGRQAQDKLLTHGTAAFQYAHSSCCRQTSNATA